MSQNRDISKLPVWAQTYIDTLKRQRDTAVAALNEVTDLSTPSKVLYERMDCTSDGAPTVRQFFVQSDVIHIVNAGIFVRISAYPKDRIDISYGGSVFRDGKPAHGGALRDICLSPTSYQQFSLIAKSNMRD